MAEKIEIAEFSIDIEALTNAAAQTQKAIQEIRNEQKELVKDGKGADQAFVRNAVNLRGLQKDYNAQLKVLDQYINTSEKQVSVQQRVDIALSREATTIEQLRAQNSELTKVRNQVNIETEEGQRQLAALNAQLDHNNALIKENVSEREQQVMSVGGYTDAIKEAFQNTGLFGGALTDVKSAMAAMSPIFSQITNQLRNISEGFTDGVKATKDMSTAQKAAALTTNGFTAALKLLRVALIATGIGAIVVLLGSFVAYLNSSEQASNRLGRVLGSLGGVVSRLLDYLEPLGEFVMDVLVEGFDLLGRTADRVLKGLSSGLAALGFDNAAQSVTRFGNAMSKASSDAERLTEMQQKYTDAQRKAGIVQLQYQRDAEKFRQIRDDENRTIQERIEANEQLAAVLEEQLQKEQAIAAQALAIANLRIAQDGRTAANLDAQAEAMERMIDIQERITGQESEQLTNRVSLQKEAADQAKAAAQDRVDAMNQELALYEAQQGVISRTLEQELALEQDIANRKKEILDAELKAKLISQTEYQTALAEMRNSQALTEAEIAQKNLERELRNVEDRIQIEAALSDAIGIAKIQGEERRFKELQEARASMLTQQFEQDLINERDYADAMADIRKETLIQENEFRKARAEEDKSQKAEQLELDLETQLLSLETLYASEQEIRELQIEQDRERALEQARLRFTDSAMLAQAELNIDKQYALAKQQLEIEKNRAIWQSRADLAGALSQIFGEETAIGKAAGIAQATVNTYVGMTEALKLPWPLNLAAAASTLATGLGAVRNITSTGADVGTLKTPEYSAGTAATPETIALNAVPPFAKGGVVKKGMGYPIRRSNGDNILATVRTGEVFLNKEQQAALGGDAVFRAIGVPGFAGGGLVGSSSTTVQSALFAGIENQLADTIGKAVQQGARAGTEVGSRQGIFDLSTERYLRDLSSL